ncbi:MAG: caspase family protein [Xanthobacteraceae bacterium]|nr:caspase family protein [Xanthobacteraceae bacterium]
MVDRRAVIVGSWLAKGRAKPSPQRINGITRRWTALFERGTYGWRSVSDPGVAPTALHNPTRTGLLTQFMDPVRVTEETELLFYFVGHSTSVGDDDVALILSTDENGADSTVKLSTLLTGVRDSFPGPLIFILDTCHAGRTLKTFTGLRDRAYAMFAAGDAYAFNADFSDMLLRALETPIGKNDQRIDRKLGGITYAKLFQDTRRRLNVGGDAAQEPVAFGDLGGRVLRDAPAVVGERFNPFASSRSVYSRAREMLLLIGDGITASELAGAVRASAAFVLDRNGAREITNERIREYVAFIRRVRWMVEPGGVLKLTDRGRSALEIEAYNRYLLDDIERFVLPDGIKLTDLDELVAELLDDLIPPTPGRLKERAAMNGKVLELDAATRMALMILPSTGRYLKASSGALFPSEPG